MLRELLIVFYRPAVAGSGRPALVEAMGEDGALVVQRELFAHVRALAGRLAETGRDVVFAAESPDEGSRRELHLDGFPLIVQGRGELGERLARISAGAFAGGVKSLVFLLTDSPVLSPLDIDAVFTALSDVDVAVTSSQSDGCVLLGLSGNHPAIFENAADELIVSRMRNTCAANGVSLRELPSRWTVETPADFEKALELGLLHVPALDERQG